MMNTNELLTFCPGQRWVSEAEPELGLGVILQVEGRRVTLNFPATGEVRTYMAASAPLNRARYAPGDTVTDGASVSFTVETVEEQNGLLIYHGDGQALHEGGLCESLVFNRPQDRILNGVVNDGPMYTLRRRTLNAMHRYAASPPRGLQGGRVSLIPHQLYVVESVVNRISPRVLLSDEIGLGKTIEACMILHRKLRLGQITRALILVPPALVHQWFIELLRRFSLKAAIYDEERCAALAHTDENPFLDEQIILCDIEWLAGSPRQAVQAVDAGWDMLIVDEAHHLEWAPGQPGQRYALVEALAQKSDGVLLLTATPEEMGEAGHFARLRLLDPDRYTILEAFLEEQKKFDGLVPLAEALQGNKPFTKAQKGRLAEHGLNPDAPRETLLRELVDCYGPGRVIFRNTRRIIKGFPERKVHLSALPDAPDALAQWFVQLLKKTAPAKIFAIVHTREAVMALYNQLKERTGIPMGFFHEEMNLIQRDRQAAWFADPEGARVLLSSEIGGEGRNFQFAHHLVMLDVPLNPEVIEQRIGRLDRIGQAHAIHVHVPYTPGAESERNALWLHEGLNIFSRPLPGAHEVYTRFRAALESEATRPGDSSWPGFIRDVQRECADVTRRMLHGRDRLLELQSYRAEDARHWVEVIQALDADTALETFLLDLFEGYGIHPEITDARCWVLRPDPIFTDSIPGFPREGMTITFDRAHALTRDDIGFMTWDHPLVQGAMERMLTSADGNAAITLWPGTDQRQLLVEATFILQLADIQSTAARYLPPTPIHITLDDRGAPWAGPLPTDKELTWLASMTPAEQTALRDILPPLLRQAESLAQEQADTMRATARAQLTASEQAELRRLNTLKERNTHITPREIEEREHALTSALRDLETAAVRLDALRLIFCK